MPAHIAVDFPALLVFSALNAALAKEKPNFPGAEKILLTSCMRDGLCYVTIV
jgi:hypothetical protein